MAAQQVPCKSSLLQLSPLFRIDSFQLWFVAFILLLTCDHMSSYFIQSLCPFSLSLPYWCLSISWCFLTALSFLHRLFSLSFSFWPFCFLSSQVALDFCFAAKVLCISFGLQPVFIISFLSFYFLSLCFVACFLGLWCFFQFLLPSSLLVAMFSLSPIVHCSDLVISRCMSNAFPSLFSLSVLILSYSFP